MKNALAVLVACALLSAAGPAAAQAPASSPSAEPLPQPPGRAGTKLKLGLDEAVQPRPRITFGPATKDAQSGLPSLGGDARPIEPAPRPRSSPYPQDTNPGQ
jgi:hypothetical protein